ncbi:hypothetical protein LguiB_017798 [Lonicera macranthoides]
MDEIEDGPIKINFNGSSEPLQSNIIYYFISLTSVTTSLHEQRCHSNSMTPLLKYVHINPNMTSIKSLHIAKLERMENFTTLIVNMMKSEGLYAPQGGPIILSQVKTRCSRSL